MDNSLYRIIRTLIENGPTTTDELAYLEDVGNRTIENRIKDLAEILEDTADINKHGNTYSLAIHKYDEFLKIETRFLKGALDLNDPSVREMTIINSLLNKKDYVSIDQISDEVGLDKRVINHTLTSLKERLGYYTASIDNKRGMGLRIDFQNEIFSLLLLKNIYQANRRYLDSDAFKQNKALIEATLLDPKIITKIALNLTAFETIRKNIGKIIDPIPNFIPMWDANNQDLKKLISSITDKYNDLSKSELEFILYPLNLYKNQYLDSKIIEQIFLSNKQVIQGSLNKSLVHYRLNADIVYERIKWHVLFLINRTILHEQVTGVLPKNISEKYPVAFEFALSLAHLIEEKYNVKVNINEINYLVLYFEMAIEKLVDKRQDTATSLAVIGNYRSSVKKFIVTQLENIFPNSNVDIVDKKDDLSANKNYLFILSQKLFRYDSVPVFNINVLFREDALNIIAVIALIERYIEENKVTVIRHDLQVKSYYGLVKELVDLLVSDGQLTADFYERWTKREKKSNNVISNGIAIPHAVDSSGKPRVLLSFGIVKQRVTYNKTRLKLIFLIGIPAKLDDSLVEVTSRIYDLISMVSRNQVLFENAENYDNNQSFIQMLEGI
ncbi:PRD domain-containing protein [Lactobacillus amylovorus]|uniref:BglG family transcription antiterminator n=1 Tax=Lactobacillus amylovorus TaxID=1604 RepID=UPI0021A66F33|nr:PTS sugar transporter subunit IIA [Lactobacillus amylovorus]MCT3585634.1 PRD domain-containing protein [Lactobacillus amylovorus]